MLADALAGVDELLIPVVSGIVVGRLGMGRVVVEVSVGEGNSSVQVSVAEVTGRVLDTDGPVVAYVRLGTYEPVLLELSSPVPIVPLAPEIGAELDPVPGRIGDTGIVAPVEGLVLLSGEAVNCALELTLSRAVILILEVILLPAE